MDNLDKNEEELFRNLMSNSNLKLPFSDFEDMVMVEIKEKEIGQNTTSKDLKLSWMFFVIGSVFGIAISILLPLLKKPIFGIRSEVIAVIFQMTFATLLFTQIENFVKIFKKSFNTSL